MKIHKIQRTNHSEEHFEGVAVNLPTKGVWGGSILQVYPTYTSFEMVFFEAPWIVNTKVFVDFPL